MISDRVTWTQVIECLLIDICWQVENNLSREAWKPCFELKDKSFYTGIKSVFQNVLGFFFIYIIFFHDYVNVGFIKNSQIEWLLGVKIRGCGSGIVIIFHMFFVYKFIKLKKTTLFWRTPGSPTLQYLFFETKIRKDMYKSWFMLSTYSFEIVMLNNNRYWE